MALHIRRSLKFEDVANTIVQEIRRFLEADRTIIYRFNPDMSGVIVAEAIIPPWLPCLNAQVEDTCFQENMGGEYQKGKVFAAADIYAANLTECHIQLLERFQVRANLVVPILLNGNNTLWGLLIAHQCSAPRQWHEEDIQLLHQLSVHLSIALQQAELYQDLQTMNSSLEEKVRERTKKIQLQAQVLEEIHDGVVTTDRNGTILSWNRGAEKLYGYTEAEVLGQNIAFLYEDVETLQTEVITPLLDKGSHATEVVVISKSGKRIYLSLRLSVVKDEQGNITHLIGCSNDITKRKQAELELRRSESRFRQLFESDVVGTLSANFQGQITDANDLFLDMLGYTRQELESNLISWKEITPPEYVAADLMAMSHLLEYGTITPWEKQYYRKDSSRISVLLGAVLLPDSDDQTICIAVDISDRKKAEEQLRQLNEQLETQVEQRTAELKQSQTRLQEAQTFARLGSWELDVATREVQWSQELFDIFKIDPEHGVLTFEQLSSYFTPKDIKLRNELVDRAILYAEPFEIDLQIVRADGTIGYILSKAKPIVNEAGQVTRLLGISMDISDRKIAEESLRESEQRFITLAEAAPVAIFRINQANECIYFNQFWSQITGREVSAALGHGWFDTVHPDDQASIQAEWIKVLSQNGHYEGEGRTLRPDGTICSYYCQAVPELNENGDIVGYIGTLTDISDRKLAEVQLRQQNIELQQLVQLREEALTLREDMSNMIVHDLRNPLSGILLSAEIIKKYGDRPDQQPLMAKKAEQILTSGKRLKDMIDSLLFMAKLESGKILFNPVSTDLHELGASVISDFELTAQSQRIELKGELPKPGNSIFIDEIILRRVIENLISNALKFSPPNSQVRLQIEYFPENHLRVKVTDNWPGVSPDQAEDIFKKFEIGAVKQNVSQIGLGLAFCKMAVEAQGGTLAIAPNQPQGSIFTLEI